MRDKWISILYIVLNIIIVVGLLILGCWFAKIIWNSDLPEWLKILLISH